MPFAYLCDFDGTVSPRDIGAAFADRFSPDGSALYGTSYYTGVSNVFRFEIASGTREALSNAAVSRLKAKTWRKAGNQAPMLPNDKAASGNKVAPNGRSCALPGGRSRA